MVGSTVGRYRVVARLGRGGYATVWRAHDTLLGRDVALKLLDERLASSIKARRRFLHEAQATAALDHPGIIAVHDSGECDGHVYIALSLIDGETLSDRIARRLLPLADAVRIVCAAADALGHAHERNVVHRDVTSRNIMVARDGRVIVLDFGLALAAWESRVTSTETTLGTAYYMAPEIMRGGEADSRSDLYGLGVVLYEALTGSFPFVGQQPHAVFYAAMNLEPVSPRERRPELPTILERVVMKAIAREPGHRFQTAAAFSEALRTASTAGADPYVVKTDRAGSIGSTQTPATPGPSRAYPGAAKAARYLAVLPFESDGPLTDPDGSCALIAGRLAQTIKTAISGSPGIRVVADTPATLPAAPQDVARELGANVLLSGSVRRAGSRLRVSFSLVDPWGNVVLGGGVVDGSALQAFDIEDELVAGVTGALGITSGMASPPSSRPHDPAARERYRQALGYLRNFDSEASVDGALALLERLIASEGEAAPYQATLARAFLYKYRLTGQRMWESRAATACARARVLGPDLIETHLALGHLRSVCVENEAALREYERALELDPGCVDALLGAGLALRELARYPEAVGCCQRAIAAEPEDWRGHRLLGWIHSRSGDHERALGCFRRVVELAPASPRGQRDLGTALYRLDRFDEAVTAYRASIAIEPDDEAYSNLGTALYYLNRCDEAIAALRKATELAPLDPLRWGNLGNACHWIEGCHVEGDSALDRAIALMQERLLLHPGQDGERVAEWWYRLAGWLVNRGRREEAATAISRALDLAPDDITCLVHAGRVHLQLGDREASLRCFRKAREAGCPVGDLARSRELSALREDPEFRRLFESRDPRPGATEASELPPPVADGAGGGSDARPGAVRDATSVSRRRRAHRTPRRIR